MNNTIIPIYTAEDIAEKVKKVGKKISEDYYGKKILLVGVLKGAFLFLADLIRNIENVDFEVSFIRAKSYNGNKSTGNVEISCDDDLKNFDFKDHHVIIVEDILDTGLTIAVLKDYFDSKGAESVKVAAFMDKPSNRVNDIKADYFCYEFNDDKFVVGYGLDYNESYRQLPFVGELVL